jgi:hypothetical protein
MDKLGIHKAALLTHFAASSGIVETNRLPDWPSSPALQRQTYKPGFNVHTGI